MKIAIIKPVIWNNKKYIGPSGHPVKSGYPAQYGFGHEEWNNSPAWIWKGYKIFHTESLDKLLTYSINGDLGILMIASYKGKQFAVGIAAGVFHNTEDEMKMIANELNLYENWIELWKIDRVRYKFNNNEIEFKNFWEKQQYWIRWKVDPDFYYWFENPIELIPAKITGKKRLPTMFGKYQAMRPGKIIDAVGKYIPAPKGKIIDWFLSGEFDELFLPKKMQDPQTAKRQKYQTKRKQTVGPTSPSREFEYWVYGKRIAEPLHYALQEKFIAYLQKNGYSPLENQDCIDVQYKRDGKRVIVEVKPTKKVPPKYAIRAAIGQLFEYRFFYQKDADLEIVLDDEPSEKDKKFLKHLCIGFWFIKDNKFIKIN